MYEFEGPADEKHPESSVAGDVPVPSHATTALLYCMFVSARGTVLISGMQPEVFR